MHTLDQLRRLMPVCRKWAYFDHAAVSPLPAPTRDAISAWAEHTAENGDVDWCDWVRRVEDARALTAGLLAAEAVEVAMVRNTTEGVALVAEGFPWREGDNVVLPAGEFPTNRFAWLNLARRGVEARLVACEGGRVELDAIAAACDARTRIVAVSWIDYAAGWRNDVAALAELAHERGAYLFLDAIQGLGVFPLDVKAAGVDFLAADGHKWLLGPEGAAVFYLRREHLDLLAPLGVGWNSAERAYDYSSQEMRLKPSAARYEGGTFPLATFVGFAESLRLLTAHPTSAFVERILDTTDRACERLESLGANIVSDRSEARKSGIVAFELPGQDPAAVRHRCREQGVVLSCRDGRLRISPHAYTNEDDLERLMAAIQ